MTPFVERNLLIKPEGLKLKVIRMGSTVPKTIHQTYTNEVLPSEIRENINKLKELNPDWKYCYYNDDDMETYIKRNFPEVLEFYQRINPKYGAARADLFRYLLMYKEGGVYLDIKSSFSRPLDNTIKPTDKFLLSHWINGKGERFEDWGIHPEISNPKGEYQQCFIVATQGHPFLKAVIENVLGNIDIYSPYTHGVGRLGVLRVTGPIAYTLSITPLLYSYEYRLIQGDKDMGFIYSIYDSIPSKVHGELFKTNYYSLAEPVVQYGLIEKIARLKLVSSILKVMKHLS